MITPEDIAKQRFLVTVRGFDRDEVRNYLTEVGDEVRRLRTRIAELEGEAARSRTAEAEGGSSTEAAYRSLGEETTRVLMAAEESAREIQNRAQADAVKLREEAQKEASDTVEKANKQAVRQVAEAEQRRNEVAADLQALKNERDTFVASLKQAVAEITGNVRGLQPEPEASERSAKQSSESTEPADEDAEQAGTGQAEDAADDEVADDGADTATDEVAGPSGVAAPAAPVAPAEEEQDERYVLLSGAREQLGRDAKRQLQDIQNEVLAAIREQGAGANLDDLLPADGELDQLGAVAEPHLEPLYTAALEQGATAAGGTLGAGATDEERLRVAQRAFGVAMSNEVTSGLRATLRAGLEAAEAEAQLSERVGEIFRDLRGPILDGVMDEQLLRLHGLGLLDAWSSLDVEQVSWVVAEESRCPENQCHANADESPVTLGGGFPSGDVVPPAHPGCNCTIQHEALDA